VIRASWAALLVTAFAAVALADEPPAAPPPAGATPAAGAPAPSDTPAAPSSATTEAAPAPAPAPAPSPAAEAPAPSLDFDLLAPPTPAPTTLDSDLMLRRRRLLTLHQGFGFGLAALMAGSIVTGQLNYNDRFRGPSTGKFRDAHRLFVYSTTLTFAATGLLALFAPVPPGQAPRGLDRVRLHEIGMIGATAGMASEVVLGILTRQAEGRVGQARLAQTHLAIGYTTFAFMVAALGAIVF
jgi:hypothetical protein